MLPPPPPRPLLLVQRNQAPLPSVTHPVNELLSLSPPADQGHLPNRLATQQYLRHLDHQARQPLLLEPHSNCLPQRSRSDRPAHNPSLRPLQPLKHSASLFLQSPVPRYHRRLLEAAGRTHHLFSELAPKAAPKLLQRRQHQTVDHFGGFLSARSADASLHVLLFGSSIPASLNNTRIVNHAHSASILSTPFPSMICYTAHIVD